MKHFKKWSLGLLSTILLVSLLAACGSDDKASADKEETTKEEKSGAYSGEKLEKYNTYVKLSNAVNTEFPAALTTYFQNYSDENGKFKKSSNDTYSLGSVSQTENAIKAVNDSTNNSSLSVDSDAKKLVKDLENDTKIFRELETYYTSKGYIDDDFKKAVTLHNELLKSSETTNKDIKSFNEKMGKIIETQQDAAAKEMKDAGQITIYNINDFISKTEKLVTNLDSQNINSANVLDTDLASYEEAYNTFTKSYDALIKASKDEKQLKKEDLTTADISGIVSSATETKADASSLLNRIKNKEAVPQSNLENPTFLDTTDGTPEKLMASYSSLVDAYNNFIRFQ
ncbi:DUF3829 domain-containing protein [Listeria welshimeri]|nr:DUF3829 domain-containing protein [Listeria welshimeri]